MADTSGQLNDFFISYTKADERWAEWIGWILEEAGYHFRLMAWDFRPGHNFVLEMQNATATAKQTLAILSPDYKKSDFCKPEWAAAFAGDPTGEQRKLIFVRVADCKNDGMLAGSNYIDLLGKNEAQAKEELLKGLQEGRSKPAAKPAFPNGSATSPARPTNPPFPGSLPSIWTVPFRRNLFLTGREKQLEELDQAITKSSAIAVTQPVAVHGLGGIGKTQLAVEYAFRHAASYDAVLWIMADTVESLRANFAALAGPQALNLPAQTVAEQQVQLQAVLQWLHNNKRWLLIIDNADTPEVIDAIGKLLPPQFNGHLLITSRRTNFSAHYTEIRVDVLEPAQAADFLLKRIEDKNHKAGTREESLSIAKVLGRFPLALEQAAAYIIHHRIGFAEYGKLLKESKAQILAIHEKTVTAYDRSVTETWWITEKQLSPMARTLLRLIGLMAPEDIPRDLFTQGSAIVAKASEEIGGTPATTAEESTPAPIESALVELNDYSMINLMPNTISCHRLVQEVQRHRIEPSCLPTWIEYLFDIIKTYMIDIAPWDVRSWPQWTVMNTHVKLAVESADKLSIAHPTAKFMGMLGSYLDARADMLAAEPLLRRALIINEKSLGPDHPDVARDQNNLALLLKATNRLSEAETLMRSALAIDEKSLGMYHPEIAIRLNNLALLLMETNRLKEAEPMLRQALAINEKNYGQEHPAVAIDLNNLAQLLKDTNRQKEAEPMMRQALIINEISYGPYHPDVAIRLNNLAQLLQDTNRLKEAEPLMQRALAIDEKSYGTNHPSVAIDLNNLAQLLKSTNRLNEAEPLMKRALAIDENCYGSDHPRVATRLNNLALLLQDTNRLKEAEALLRRALAIDEKSYGPYHPEVAINLNNLAQLLKATKRTKEAEPLMRLAVATLYRFYQSTGHEHPNMQPVIGNYRQLLSDLNLTPREIEWKLKEILSEDKT